VGIVLSAVSDNASDIILSVAASNIEKPKWGNFENEATGLLLLSIRKMHRN
jgi:hypothetical protein